MGDGASTGAIWGDDTGLGSNGYGCDLTFLIILVVGDDDNDDDDYMAKMMTMAVWIFGKDCSKQRTVFDGLSSVFDELPF